MKLSRPSRFVAALVALFSILFMQLALAGYACPDLEAGEVSESAGISVYASDQSMPGCEGMDTEQPNLCHAHAQAGKQSLDKPGLPLVQPFIAAALTLVFQDIQVIYNPGVVQPDPLLLTRATALPLSIRNCCFRI